MRRWYRAKRLTRQITVQRVEQATGRILLARDLQACRVGQDLLGRPPGPPATRVLVSSAKGANGDGYGAVLAFDLAGNLLGTFCEDNRITDPRGLCVDPTGDLLYVNSGNDRILALDRKGQIRRETSPIEGLDPGGGVFGPDGRYYVGSRF